MIFVLESADIISTSRDGGDFGSGLVPGRIRGLGQQRVVENDEDSAVLESLDSACA